MQDPAETQCHPLSSRHLHGSIENFRARIKTCWQRAETVGSPAKPKLVQWGRHLQKKMQVVDQVLFRKSKYGFSWQAWECRSVRDLSPKPDSGSSEGRFASCACNQVDASGFYLCAPSPIPASRYDRALHTQVPRPRPGHVLPDRRGWTQGSCGSGEQH